jgi:hypothetical protein
MAEANTGSGYQRHDESQTLAETILETGRSSVSVGATSPRSVLATELGG